jgi:hypothetical protein
MLVACRLAGLSALEANYGLLRPALCVFNNGASSLDVMVRDVSAAGARVVSDGLVFLPRTFEPRIHAATARRARLVRTDGRYACPRVHRLKGAKSRFGAWMPYHVRSGFRDRDPVHNALKVYRKAFSFVEIIYALIFRVYNWESSEVASLTPTGVFGE